MDQPDLGSDSCATYRNNRSKKSIVLPATSNEPKSYSSYGSRGRNRHKRSADPNLDAQQEGSPSYPVLQSRSVGTDQCQVKPWPRDQRDVRSIFFAPAELELITDFFDRDGFPKRPPLAVVSSQGRLTSILPQFSNSDWPLLAGFAAGVCPAFHGSDSKLRGFQDRVDRFLHRRRLGRAIPCLSLHPQACENVGPSFLSIGAPFGALDIIPPEGLAVAFEGQFGRRERELRENRSRCCWVPDDNVYAGSFRTTFINQGIAKTQLCTQILANARINKLLCAEMTLQPRPVTVGCVGWMLRNAARPHVADQNRYFV